MIILGIDPGLHISGYAVIKKVETKIVLIEYGFLKMNPSKPLPERISEFHAYFDHKIKIFNISNLSLETPFLGRNAQNFLKLGYLRGILYLLANNNKLKISEFTPRQVKQSITGFGGAEKEQVARVILQFFPAIQMPKKLDVTDAIAVTLCGVWKSELKI